MKKALVAVSVIFLCIFFHLHLNANNSNLSLSDAIILSLKNNATYRISIEKVKESRQRVLETWGTLMPELSTDISYTRQGAETGYSSSIEAQASFNILSANLNVNPGIFYNSLQAARKTHIINENSVRKQKSDTVIQTVRLYYQLILASETVSLRQESLKALRENFRVVTEGYKKGTFSRLDFLRARVAVSNQNAMLIKTRNELESVKASLNVHMGRDMETRLVIDTDSVKAGIDKIIKSEGKNNYISPEYLVAASLKNRPELIQIKMKKEAAEYAIRAERAAYLWPYFFINGNYNTSRIYTESSGSAEIDMGPGYEAISAVLQKMNESGSSPEGWNKSWNITFGVKYRWGGWSPVSTESRRKKQAESRLNQTDIELRDLLKNVKLDVRINYFKLKSAEASIISQQGNVQAAEEAFRIAGIQFRHGIIDNSKLLDANVEAVNAKTLYIQALHDYQVAKSELNRAVGREVFRIE